jgi:hypothetical protein
MWLDIVRKAMGKILLIEPYRILRQAVSLSLFPEHEVQMEESLSASGIGSLKDYDLLIVDGAALREREQLNPEVTSAIQGCKIPTLWLEDSESSLAPKHEKLIIIKKPIEKEAFGSALAGFLSTQAAAKEWKSPLGSETPKAESGKRTSKKRGAESSQLELIDLVDVVEEEAPPKQGRITPRKSE